MLFCLLLFAFFFFNDTATNEIYTLSLHDALPIFRRPLVDLLQVRALQRELVRARAAKDRKSTRLNSSHANISYAVFRLKKKTPDVGAQKPNQQSSGTRNPQDTVILQ